MTKPNYTHAKKILTALEEGKTVEIATYSSYTLMGWNKIDSINHWEIEALGDPSMIRVKPEPEYVPLDSEDIPAVCWINNQPQGAYARLVTYVSDAYLITDNKHIMYMTLMREGYYYSEDRKNWKLCRKEKI